MFRRDKLERNIDKLNSTPEGKQALEDAIVCWEEETGELPSRQELETITTLIRQEMSPSWQFAYRLVTVFIIISFMSMCGRQIYYVSCHPDKPVPGSFYY